MRSVREDQLELNIVLGNVDQEQLNLYIKKWKKSSLKTTNHGGGEGVSDFTRAIESQYFFKNKDNLAYN